MLMMMSKVPLNSRYQPISRARIPNVWNGDMSAMIPATTNSTPSTPCSQRQASTIPIVMNSLTPAAISTKPVR